MVDAYVHIEKLDGNTIGAGSTSARSVVSVASCGESAPCDMGLGDAVKCRLSSALAIAPVAGEPRGDKPDGRGLIKLGFGESVAEDSGEGDTISDGSLGAVSSDTPSRPLL